MPPSSPLPSSNQLDKERKRANCLAEDLKAARQAALVMQTAVEQEEEFMTNKLLKRLGELKREKAELATQVEQEEEFLSNTLGRKLEAARKEKASPLRPRG